MFDNYNNIEETKQPCNIPEHAHKEDTDCSCGGTNVVRPVPVPPLPPTLEPCRPKVPFESYNAKGELDGYWWYYGDTIVLEFNITGEVVIEGSDEYVTAEDFLLGKKILFTLYDFRREEILHKEYDASTKILFEIDYKLSRELVKGTYYCSLQVYDEDDLFAKTIYAQQDCTLTVK